MIFNKNLCQSQERDLFSSFIYLPSPMSLYLCVAAITPDKAEAESGVENANGHPYRGAGGVCAEAPSEATADKHEQQAMELVAICDFQFSSLTTTIDSLILTTRSIPSSPTLKKCWLGGYHPFSAILKNVIIFLCVDGCFNLLE